MSPVTSSQVQVKLRGIEYVIVSEYPRPIGGKTVYLRRKNGDRLHITVRDREGRLSDRLIRIGSTVCSR